MVRFRKVKNKDIVNDPLHRWLVYFDERCPEKMVQEAVDIDDALKKIREKLGIIEMDPDMYRTYLGYEKAYYDEKHHLEYAEDKGFERGLKKGMEKGRKEVQAEAAVQISQITAQLDQERARNAQLQAEIERLKSTH